MSVQTNSFYSNDRKPHLTLLLRYRHIFHFYLNIKENPYSLVVGGLVLAYWTFLIGFKYLPSSLNTLQTIGAQALPRFHSHRRRSRLAFRYCQK